jgi:hypothetical protein
MKVILISLFFLVTGISGGWFLCWVTSYFASETEQVLSVDLEQLFKFSETQISDEKYSCEGNENRTVGAVLASIFQSNMSMPRNSVSLNCYENACGLIYNYCKPWQSQECGSRILRFDLTEKMEIIPESFSCIDAP